MPTRLCLPKYAALPLVLLFCACLSAASAHAALLTVNLTVTRTVLLSNGKDRTLLIARVSDPSGRQVPNGTDVQFQTTLGQLSSTRAGTFGGLAQVELTSTLKGEAQVTATSTGGVSNTVAVEFTDDPEATFQGNNYVLFSSNRYLAYSATDKIIEAIGKNGGAKMSYRNMEISADRLQLHCENDIIQAQDNVTIRRGKISVKANRLYYSLTAAQGYAIAEFHGQLRTVTITGMGLLMEPQDAPIPNTYMKMTPPQIKLVVVAQGITYFPGTKLQLRRPKFYQDQAQIMALPYYELPLNSQELFSSQFVSVGTQGLGLDLPFYYNLSPHSTGIAYLWHQQQIGRSYFSQQNGWGVDVLQGYSSQGERHYEGEYGFQGLTRSDWSFHWSHSHEFSNTAQAGFYLDFPQHNSVFTSTNYSQQYHTFRWQASMTAGQTFTSPNDSSLRENFNVETQQHRLSVLPGMMYTIGTSYTGGSIHSSDSTIGSINENTESLTMRAYSQPHAIDKRTNITNSFTFGQMWSNLGRSGLTTLADVSLDHTLPGGARIVLNYAYVDQPGGLFVSSGRHRVGLNYTLATGGRFQASVFGSAYVDAPQTSVFADCAYRLNKNWQLYASATLQQYEGDSIKDLQFTVGRRIGARQLQLTYSLYLKRISLDLMSARF